MVTHNILLLQSIFLLFSIHYIKIVWLLFFVIELSSSIFLDVQCRIVSCFVILSRFSFWRAMSCFWFGFYVFVDIIVIFNLNKILVHLYEMASISSFYISLLFKNL